MSSDGPITGAPSKRVPREYPIAQIIEVHDGDTVRAWVDQGFGEWAKVWIRLQGVNAQELSKPGGPEAGMNLESILSLHAPGGWLKLVTFWSEGSTKEIKEERTFIRYVGRLVGRLDNVDINEVQARTIAGTEMEGGM